MRTAAEKILERTALAERLAGRGEKRVALANGVFDLLHVGHARLLADARSQVDVLVLALNDDDSARACKGAGRPILSLPHRLRLIASLRAVDWVTWFPETTVARTLEILEPRFQVKGTDYRPETLPPDEQELHERLGVEVLIAGDPKQHGTTDLISLVRSRHHP